MLKKKENGEIYFGTGSDNFLPNFYIDFETIVD